MSKRPKTAVERVHHWSAVAPRGDGHFYAIGFRRTAAGNRARVGDCLGTYPTREEAWARALSWCAALGVVTLDEFDAEASPHATREDATDGR